MPPSAGRKRIITKSTAPRRGISLRPKGGRRGVGTLAHGSRRADMAAAHETAKKGMARCPNCGALYYDKHWHSPEALVLERTTVYLEPLKEQWCYECKAGHLSPGGVPMRYSGEVVIEGNWTPQTRSDLLHLMRNIGHRAMVRDPEDRIIRILEQDGKFLVYTSENQLAVSIGKQVHTSHKGGELHIVWSADDKPVRVSWKAKG